jgi:hypothetical protein
MIKTKDMSMMMGNEWGTPPPGGMTQDDGSFEVAVAAAKKQEGQDAQVLFGETRLKRPREQEAPRPWPHSKPN